MREYTFPLCGEDVPVHTPENEADLAEFATWIRMQTGAVAVDTESRGLDILCGDPGYIRMVQFGTADVAWNIVTELGPAFKEAARSALLTLPKLIGHNVPFDALGTSAHLGLDLQFLMDKWEDTQVRTKLIDSRQKMEGGIGSGLKDNAAHYIDPSAPDTQGDLTAIFNKMKLTKANGFARIDVWNETYQSYGGGDVILTARLLPILDRVLAGLMGGRAKTMVAYEQKVSYICARMQQTGLVLDRQYTRDLAERLGEEAETFTLEAQEYGVEKIGSPAQLAAVLMDPDGFNEDIPERTDNGAVRVDKAVLCRLADIDFRSGKELNTRTPNPLAVAVIKAKRAAKWRKAYALNFLERMDQAGRIHPGIRTMAARTGRMSVTDPAVQTLPSRDWMIRRCFLAEEGHVIIGVDFAAVELRVLAALADVRKMKEAIREGRDLHSFTAELLFGPDFTKDQREMSKGIAFSKVFGGGAENTARLTGAPLEDVKRAMAAYDRVYPEVKRFAAKLQREAMGNGMVVTSATGRRLPLDRDRVYAATNYVVQSTARDCLGQVLINLDKAGLTQYLRLPIHDEVILSVPAERAEEIAKKVEECMTFDLFGVPIDAEAEIMGRTWGSGYMRDKKGKLIPELLIEQDEWYAAHPEVAYARAAA